MRIAQIATLSTPVRPTGSGSIEGVVWLLTRELTRMGHEVTVFAAVGSKVEGHVVETLCAPYGSDGNPGDWQICEWHNLCRAVEQSDRFDVLHSHAYFHGLPLEPLSRAPMVHTLHIMGSDEFVRQWALRPSACVTAISHYQWSLCPQVRPAAVIHHGVDESQFTFRELPEDYVCYLGRFTPQKGPLLAIETARKLSIPLILAGPANDYFRQHVQPLVDGKQIQYADCLGGRRRDLLLGGARALLYPIQQSEPFGLVMPEAMFCGTPVAALSHGAVGELVDEGVTGFAARSNEEYPQAVLRALELNRAHVRERALHRFSARHMAKQYVEVYQRLTGGRRP